jgi:hypothetical protein
MLRRAAALAVVTWLAAGCSSSSTSHQSLGTFTVSGQRTKSCAEQGLLAMPPKISYRVSLSRVGTSTLHWREATVGLLIGEYRENDGSFAVGQYLRSDLREPKSKLPPCLLERILKIEGAIEKEQLTGKLRYLYQPTQGSSCADLTSGSTAIATSLPCSIELDIEGQRDKG